MIGSYKVLGWSSGRGLAVTVLMTRGHELFEVERLKAGLEVEESRGVATAVHVVWGGEQ